MYNRRSYDAAAIAISILVGIAFAILSFFDLLTASFAAAALGLALAAFALLILTLGATSLLRQNDHIDRCICQRSRLLLTAAILLFIVAALTLLLTPTNPTIILILVFLLFALLSLTLIALYAFLACLTNSGCENCQ